MSGGDNSKTKILMLGWEFPPHNSGGLGVACLGLASALVDRNVDITFVLPKKLGTYHDKIRMLFANVPNISFQGVDTALTPYITSRDYELSKTRDEHNLYGATLFEETARYAELIRDIARREEFDVIHAHDWLSILAGVEAKKVSGKPLILHVHATSFDQSAGDNVDRRVYGVEKKGMETADMIITVSQFTKDIVEKKYGISPEKIRVVHNGVSPDTSSDREEKKNHILALKDAGYKVVLFLGRITIQKGPDYFLRAAQKALQYEPKTVFVVSGSGDMEAQMIREAANLGISDKVLFSGFTRGSERRCLLHSADLFIMPSVSEPFGLVPLEALLEGNTPVIISKQSGVSEVLRNALKVDFWDVDETANKIVAVLRHEPLRNQLTSLGRSEAESITWEKAAEKCIGLYHELISQLKTT